MRCNGKCYLAKQFKEQEKQEKQGPVSKKLKLDIQLFYAVNANVVEILSLVEMVPYKPGDDQNLSTFPHTIFHPPMVLG
jgi:hypothetical protein